MGSGSGFPRLRAAALVALLLAAAAPAAAGDGIRFTLVINPGKIYRGTEVKISGIIPNHNAYACSERVKIEDPSGQVVSSGDAQDWLINDDTKFKYSWTVPRDAPTGTYTAKVVVVCQGYDPSWGSKEPSFSVLNHPPVIGSVSVGPRRVKRTKKVTIRMNASDPDGTISEAGVRVISPSGNSFSVRLEGGSASWSPPPGCELGDYDVVAWVVDNDGEEASKTYRGAFSVENVPPKIVNLTVSRPRSGRKGWGVRACSTDPDDSPGGVNLSLRVTSSPGGLLASGSTSKKCLSLSFSPPSNARTVKIEARAVDGDGGEGRASRTIKLGGGKSPPGSGPGSGDSDEPSGDLPSGEHGKGVAGIPEERVGPGEAAAPPGVELGSLTPAPGGKLEARFLVYGPPGVTASVWVGNSGEISTLDGEIPGELTLEIDARGMGEGDELTFGARVFSGVSLVWEGRLSAEVPGWSDLRLTVGDPSCTGGIPAEVANLGTEPAEAEVSAEFGGDVFWETNLTLEPWGRSELEVPLPPNLSGGAISVYARPVGRGDLNPGDNRASVEISCAVRLDVDVISPGGGIVEADVTGDVVSFNYTVYVDGIPVGGGSSDLTDGRARLRLDSGGWNLSAGPHEVRVVVESSGLRAEDSARLYVPSGGGETGVGAASWSDLASAFASPYFLPIYAVLAAYLVRRRLAHS